MARTESPIIPPPVQKLVDKFVEEFRPVDKPYIVVDNRTGAHFCECYIRGRYLVELATTDVPLDPEEQPEYRANREIVTNAPAFAKMQDDALKRRTFSNIVTEFTTEFDPEKPLKIIGGQHRYEAIAAAWAEKVNELHGVKVYFGLDKDQRLDVQLISNTSIAISGDLFDRMQETVRGPHLRDWCQSVGLLEAGQDFADRRTRGGPISVQMARTFILNHLAGRNTTSANFDASETSPTICSTGSTAADWEALMSANPKLFEDAGLKRAGTEFQRLVQAQRVAFKDAANKKPDFPDKALNMALLAGWAYVSGVLQGNEVRLARHYGLASTSGGDPLRAAILAKGKHRTDPDNYRGLGYRADAKERGRFAELFFIQAEKGEGISKPIVDLAISKFHAKEALLEVKRIEAKATN
jgi:hypothetical protein